MRLRVARPTQRLSEIVRFYGEGVGLARLAAWEGHDGYDGVVFGAPGRSAEVEFTRRDGAAAPARAEDAHLVLSFERPGEQERAVARLRALGYAEATPANPWWRSRGATFLDPDGWEVVLVAPAAP